MHACLHIPEGIRMLKPVPHNCTTHLLEAALLWLYITYTAAVTLNKPLLDSQNTLVDYR